MQLVDIGTGLIHPLLGLSCYLIVQSVSLRPNYHRKSKNQDAHQPVAKQGSAGIAAAGGYGYYLVVLNVSEDNMDIYPKHPIYGHIYWIYILYILDMHPIYISYICVNISLDCILYICSQIYCAYSELPSCRGEQRTPNKSTDCQAL